MRMAAPETKVSMKFLALFPLRAIPTGRADSVWSDQLEGPFLL